MELNNGVVVFLALVSVLGIGCLTFTSLNNAHLIAELQLELQQLTDECNNGPQASVNRNAENEDLLNKVMNEIIKMLPDEKDQQNTKQESVHRLRRSVMATNQETNYTNSWERGPESPSPPPLAEKGVQLLANALFGIVDRQLNLKLDCTELEDETECSILPGPKGEKGERGPQGNRGPVGEKGDKGNLGGQGIKGAKGQLGFPGYKGERGQMGDTGLPGPVGPRGNTGPVGPVATLRQAGCSWLYTDTCGHGCGAGTQKRVTCPPGQYVAGFGILTWEQYGRYNTHIYCCPV